MPRPKKPVELQEGPEAYENFRDLASRLIRAPRPDEPSLTVEQTTVVVEEQTETTPSQSRPRRKSK
jgi:hypothetical protein